MELSRELLFFFSGLGAFNGIMLGLYFLIYKKPRLVSNKYLGGLLLMMSIRIGKSVFFYFNEALASVYLQIGLSACLMIGPFLFGYVMAIESPLGKNEKYRNFNLLFWIPIILIVNITYPWDLQLSFWRDYFIPFIYIQWFCYLLASGWVLRKYIRRLFSRKDQISKNDFWILSIYISNVVIWFAYAVFPFVSYIIGALSFTFILYLWILILFFSKGLTTSVEKYVDKKIDDDEAAQLIYELEKAMVEEKLFKDSNLLLPDLAKKMKILPHRLSQLINDNLGTNYTAYINEHRIEEAKMMIASNDHFKLETIGYECGFNSRSTFFATFKKYTGTTPAKYKKSLTTFKI